MASRIQVAGQLAGRLETDRKQVIQETAAWLVNNGKIRQTSYMARDVAGILAEKGYVLVNVTTARPLSDVSLRALELFIKEQTGAHELELSTTVDPDVIGGVNIETPLATVDATVRTKLARYVEGVMN